jgi:hypothetical protein
MDVNNCKRKMLEARKQGSKEARKLESLEAWRLGGLLCLKAF